MAKAPAILLTTCWGKIFEDQGPFVTWNGQIRWQRMCLSCSKLFGDAQKWQGQHLVVCRGIIYESWGCRNWGTPSGKIGFHLALNALILTDHDPISTSSVGYPNFRDPSYVSVVRSLEIGFLKGITIGNHPEYWPNKSIFFIFQCHVGLLQNISWVVVSKAPVLMWMLPILDVSIHSMQPSSMPPTKP